MISGEGRVDRQSLSLRGDVARAKTNRRVSRGDITARVMRRPASLFAKKSNGADVAVFAKIEPMSRASGHIDQIPGLNLNAQDRTRRRVDVKNPVPSNNEPNFVFGMGMFLVELVKHRLKARNIGSNVNDIRRHITALLLERFDLRTKSR